MLLSSGYCLARWLWINCIYWYIANYLQWVNSAFYPCGVGISSTGLRLGLKWGCIHLCDDDDDDDGDDDDEGRINFSMALSPKTTRTHNNKPKHWSHGFQSAAEILQRRRWPDWLWQTVPDRCSSRWKGAVTNGRTHRAWSDQHWCSWRAQSSTCVEVWHVLKIWSQVARCRAVEAAIH